MHGLSTYPSPSIATSLNTLKRDSILLLNHRILTISYAHSLPDPHRRPDIATLPKMSTYPERLASFACWPHKLPSPEALANAGFSHQPTASI